MPRRRTRPLSDADHVTTINFINNRLVSNYMETRACLAEWDATSKKFTLTLGSQGVHSIRRTLANDVFRMDLEDFRVVTKGCRRRIRHQGLQLPGIPAVA